MSQPEEHRYRFGPFRLDPQERLLLRDEEPVPLTPKVFDTLTFLIRHRGHLVLKEELMQNLWPDSFVGEDNLVQNISVLRKALGEKASGQRYIVTVPGKGYRFAAEVLELTPASDQQGGLLVGSYTHSQMLIEEEEETDDASFAQSSQRTIPVSRRWRVAGIVAVLIVGVLAFSFYSRHKVKVAQTDKIVLADFDNKSGDPVFDDTLKQALAVQLEQSPFLNVLSDQKVSEELRLMGRARDEHLSWDLAREVCQRSGSKAALLGSISRLGSHYVIGLNALNCEAGDALAREQVEADSREHVLQALSEGATKMRRQLGESLNSIRGFDLPIYKASTTSLEALKAFSLAQRTWSTQGDSAALPLYKLALELDPKFAMAYAHLGNTYENLGESALGAENLRKAYELREKVSERERFYIDAHYYADVTGEVEKALPVYEVWQKVYPSDVATYSDLASIYATVGKYEKGLEEALQAVRLDPDNADNYEALAIAYICLNRLDEAEKALNQAVTHKLEGETLLTDRYHVAFLKDDRAEMQRLVASATGEPGVEDRLLFWHGCTEAYHGRLTRSRLLFRQAVESAKRDQAAERIARFEVSASVNEAFLGNSRTARLEAESALGLSRSRDIQVTAALPLALVGEVTEAEKLAASLNKNFPLDTLVQRYYLPTIRAAVALERKRAKEAVDLLAEVEPYELGAATNLEPIYLRAQAYLMLRDGRAAAAEMQKVLDHPGVVGCHPVGVLARLGLARAYALQRDTAKSSAAYQDFFSAWADADADIPILRQAKAEYAKLQ
jgi:DNA-binding winged helix-turn-helix (wHTH) protein/tetratricopeptide (TPR) repeat protein